MVASDFVTRIKREIAEITESEISLSTVDVEDCDREPIHIPGAIQPHGVLLATSAKSWQIVQVSENTSEHLGRSAKSLLNQPLHTLIDEAQLQKIRDCLEEGFEVVNPLRLAIEVAGQPKHFSAVVHRSDEHIVIELEPVAASAEVSFFDFYKLVKRPVSRFQQTQSLTELCQVAVEELKQTTGFDRVMVYQLDEDESGSVVAEAKGSDMEPYLGLRYPKTDIPKQAKYLYLLNLLRLIPDVNYTPVPIVSTRQAVSSSQTAEKATKKKTKKETDEASPDKPLDMSLSILRSVSPLHVEYLSNMGVRATLAISLVHNQKLWGLLVCHHNSPRNLPYETRTICEFLGQAIALELASKASNEDRAYKLYLKNLQVQFVEALTQSQTLKEGLTRNTKRLLALTGSSGAALCDKGEITLLGETPSQEETASLVHWLNNQFVEGPLYQTSSLREVYSPALYFESQTSGLLAISISKLQQLYVVWFRPEVIKTVNWAGNPDTAIVEDEDGKLKMSPRKSFELWRENVSGQSHPWKDCELEAAMELRSAVIGLVLQRADELAEVNLELERSNVELDSFAYIASHDLKEPLRGIHNYASFLIEDYAQELGADGTDKLETLMRLTQRMEDLISSLLHYSRLGRADLRLSPVDINELVEGVIDLVKVSKPDEASFEVSRELPTIDCDRTQMNELFTNLITNAIKYNDKAEKKVEIGYLTAEEAEQANILPEPVQKLATEKAEPTASGPVFYVRDNGIGIREKHKEAVFRIFKRLHAPSRFGGGTGAGLTIAKKIVERHGGILWIDSTFGEGTTFYFTLASKETA